MNKEKYKFDPLKHGYEPISKFPELGFMYPMLDDKYFIKIEAYSDMGGLVYWYSCIELLHSNNFIDDRVKIQSDSYDTRRECTYEAQNNHGRQTNYFGLIPSDKFANELLKHLFGTCQNESVNKEGLERYTENLNEKMRKEFPNYNKNIVCQ